MDRTGPPRTGLTPKQRADRAWQVGCGALLGALMLLGVLTLLGWVGPQVARAVGWCG